MTLPPPAACTGPTVADTDRVMVLDAEGGTDVDDSPTVAPSCNKTNETLHIVDSGVSRTQETTVLLASESSLCLP